MTEQTQVTPLQARIDEVAQYEANIALYQTILQSLPTEWPERLLQYRSAKNQHDTIAGIDSADIELISKLWYADECAKFIKTETLELTKSRAILDVLQA
jgi:hypothetical protein